MRLFEATEIEHNEYVMGFNSTGDKVKMSFLDHIFKMVENDNEIVLHNHYVWHLNELLGDKGDVFKKELLLLIENLSLGSIEHGKEQKKR